MRMFAGLDVGFKRTSVCVLGEEGGVVWRGVVDTRPLALAWALEPWRNELSKVAWRAGRCRPGWRASLPG